MFEPAALRLTISPHLAMDNVNMHFFILLCFYYILFFALALKAVFRRDSIIFNNTAVDETCSFDMFVMLEPISVVYAFAS